MAMNLTVRLRKAHPKQHDFILSGAKRKVVRAGRRGGKTLGAGILAVRAFLAGRRVLYATPTEDQIAAFWFEVKRALAEPVDAGVFVKNETLHAIELPRTKQRIRAKTAFNADTLRGDYADLLILDEFQLMNEDAWELVGAPMLLDNDGDAVFIYTPPSARSAGISKAHDPRHASKLFKRAQADTTGRWRAFHFTSHDNPYLSKTALDDITADMTNLSYRMEILAEDVEDNPAALWKRADIEQYRVRQMPSMRRLVVAIDPEATSTQESAETGIIVAGIGMDRELYVIDDVTLRATPHRWASAAITAYHRNRANVIVAETNNGGEMVEAVIRSIPEGQKIPFKAVHASRGKQTRAEPIAALYEQGRAHHVGVFAELEDQLCQWMPGDKSPDRLDALVWAATELQLLPQAKVLTVETQI